MPTTLKDEAAIAGIGQTAFTKKSGVSELSLASEAVNNAIVEAGLDPKQVDGLVSYVMDSSDEVEVARSVGLGDLTFFSKINYGGGAAVGLIHQAAMAIATGSAKYVVVYCALNGDHDTWPVGHHIGSASRGERENLRHMGLRY